MSITLASLPAQADPATVQPIAALRLGAHYSKLSLDAIDGAAYGAGISHGLGVAVELEAGLQLHRTWALTTFVAYAPFTAQLDFEYPNSFELHGYETAFHDLYLGARLSYRPTRRFSIAVGVARLEIWQLDRPTDAGGVRFDSRWRTTVPQLVATFELARIDPFTVDLSIGLAGTPRTSDNYNHADVYAPVLVGFAWR